jgi:hypothetical protein
MSAAYLQRGEGRRVFARMVAPRRVNADIYYTSWLRGGPRPLLLAGGIARRAWPRWLGSGTRTCVEPRLSRFVWLRARTASLRSESAERLRSVLLRESWPAGRRGAWRIAADIRVRAAGRIVLPGLIHKLRRGEASADRPVAGDVPALPAGAALYGDCLRPRSADVCGGRHDHARLGSQPGRPGRRLRHPVRYDP